MRQMSWASGVLFIDVSSCSRLPAEARTAKRNLEARSDFPFSGFPDQLLGVTQTVEDFEEPKAVSIKDDKFDLVYPRGFKNSRRRFGARGGGGETVGDCAKHPHPGYRMRGKFSFGGGISDDRPVTTVPVLPGNFVTAGKDVMGGARLASEAPQLTGATLKSGTRIQGDRLPAEGSV